MGIGEQFELEKTGRIEPENRRPSIVAYFDGCCEPINPGGTASYGVVIQKDGETIHEASKVFLPEKGRERETSNNVAEYSGFRHILEWLIGEALNEAEIKIFGDSNLVIQQMFGSWRIKKGLYTPIAWRCCELLKEFTKISGHWIPREQNALADKLSKEELIKAGIKFRIQPE